MYCVPTFFCNFVNAFKQKAGGTAFLVLYKEGI